MALRDGGLKVPEDISIVSFDELPPLPIIEPFLTVAVQPAYEMGCTATEILLKRIKGEAPSACQEVLLPIEYIVRRSSGPVKGSR
jgi:LacI family transcriptional regulator